jgi:hypothetical protein
MKSITAVGQATNNLMREGSARAFVDVSCDGTTDCNYFNDKKLALAREDHGGSRVRFCSKRF